MVFSLFNSCASSLADSQYSGIMVRLTSVFPLEESVIWK